MVKVSEEVVSVFSMRTKGSVAVDKQRSHQAGRLSLFYRCVPIWITSGLAQAAFELMNNRGIYNSGVSPLCLRLENHGYVCFWHCLYQLKSTQKAITGLRSWAYDD
jgi:hypothetical protein